MTPNPLRHLKQAVAVGSAAGMLFLGLATTDSSRSQVPPTWSHPWCGVDQPLPLAIFDHDYPAGKIGEGTPTLVPQQRLRVLSYNVDERMDCRQAQPWTTQTATPPVLDESSPNYCNPEYQGASSPSRCWRYDAHGGIDYEMAYQPVYAADSGVMGDVQLLEGLVALVEHSDGVYSTSYGHLSAVVLQPGESVERGQRIGTSGASGGKVDVPGGRIVGGVTRAHLHFQAQVMDGGKPFDSVLDPYGWEVVTGTVTPDPWQRVSGIQSVRLLEPAPWRNPQGTPLPTPACGAFEGGGPWRVNNEECPVLCTGNNDAFLIDDGDAAPAFVCSTCVGNGLTGVTGATGGADHRLLPETGGTVWAQSASWSFRNIPQGDYLVEVSIPRYTALSGRQSVVAIGNYRVNNRSDISITLIGEFLKGFFNIPDTGFNPNGGDNYGWLNIGIFEPDTQGSITVSAMSNSGSSCIKPNCAGVTPVDAVRIARVCQENKERPVPTPIPTPH